MPTSPGGSLFPYYYKGGELFGLHLGNYFADEDRVIAMMKAEQAFFTQQNRTMGMWIDFYHTKLTSRVIGEFVEFLLCTRNRVSRLGLVGCTWQGRLKINGLLKKTQALSSLQVRYFSDPEDAKTWLVSEGS